MLLGNVFQQTYNVIDSFVVGKFVGKTALAASAGVPRHLRVRFPRHRVSVWRATS
jgi:hypothetical protein